MARDTTADTLLSTVRGQNEGKAERVSCARNLNSELKADIRTSRRATTDENISGICPGEEELRAFANGELSKLQHPAIEDHFDKCTSCFELVSAMVRNATNGSSLSGSSVWDVTYSADTLLASRFDIARFIERGGMGEVYEAFDRDLREKVALKTMLSTVSDTPEALTQLREEVKLARRVAHPNVCRVHDLHVHQDPRAGRPVVRFIAMEFIEGITLKKRLERGPLPIDTACETAFQLLAGLQAAHSAGVLHLDFKSQNVMLRSDEVGLNVAIMDFGLSRALEVEERLRTSERRVAGSAGYMSPEQIQCQPVGPASDLYSFGAVFFEMLTGQLPFAGPSAASVMLRQLKSKAAAPSKVRAGLPTALDEFVLKCLHRNPRARFESVHSAQRALEVCVRRLKVAQSTASRVRARAPTVTGWAATLGAAALIIIIAVDGSTESNISALQPSSTLSLASSLPEYRSPANASSTDPLHVDPPGLELLRPDVSPMEAPRIDPPRVMSSPLSSRKAHSIKRPRALPRKKPLIVLPKKPSPQEDVPPKVSPPLGATEKQAPRSPPPREKWIKNLPKSLL